MPSFQRATATLLPAVISLFLAGAVSGATYPNKPVRLVVGFAPGGSVDLQARLLAQKLTETWGQQVIVDNRPGAGGNISAEIVAHAANDGHTLHLSSPSLVVNPSLYARVPYDPIRDFAPVSLLSLSQVVLVAYPGLPVSSVKDLLALAKSKPGLTYAATGSGSSGHIAMELFKSLAKVELTHVPYKLNGQATTDLLSGQVSLWFPTLPGVLNHIKARRMKALGVGGARRSPALPEVPTIVEGGVPGYEASTWYALLAPTGTAPAVIATLNKDIVKTLRMPDVEEKLTAVGIEIVGSTPEELAAHVRKELPKWAQVIRRSGVRI
ncbi:MAG TPA: tripartite tricarboxylate transporter substrate binding protein, partial [Burkholderiales bacterium]|nr:tripartite tricarboxylate transporter substrate binding protein [Burkholderiales bacterium]